MPAGKVIEGEVVPYYAGRPTSYEESLDDIAWDYINGGYEGMGHAIPSIVGLAKALHRSRATLYHWAKDPEHTFSDILAACNEEQEQVLLTKGLDNTFNATIVKLALGKQGYHDKADLDHTTGGDKVAPSRIELVAPSDS